MFVSYSPDGNRAYVLWADGEAGKPEEVSIFDIVPLADVEKEPTEE